MNRAFNPEKLEKQQIDSQRSHSLAIANEEHDIGAEQHQLQPPPLQLKIENQIAGSDSEADAEEVQLKKGQFSISAPEDPNNNKDGQREGNNSFQLKAQENNTGLPGHLKSGIEDLSGFSMDDVNVHYNSDKPAQLQAHAYAQGSDIHIGPGQEEHLPHEAWHVVQQKQGRVQPTTQLKGQFQINDDQGLEKEADEMGEKATNFSQNKNLLTKGYKYSPIHTNVAQCILISSENFREENYLTGSELEIDLLWNGELGQDGNEQDVDNHEGDNEDNTVQEDLNNLSQDEILESIASYLEQYEGAQGNDEKLQLIGLMDKYLSKWFDLESQNKAFMSGKVNTNRMVVLHKQLEKEHAEIVNATKDDENFIPFNLDNLEEGETAESIKSLWRQIVNNEGKIKLGGTAEYQQATLGRIVHMLETPIGRTMLKFLNSPRPDLENDQDDIRTNIYITNLIASLPEEIRGGIDISVSQSQPLNEAASKIVRTENPDQNEIEIGNTSEYLEATLGNQRSIKVGDDSYNMGAGTGAVVFVEGENVIGHPSAQYHELFTPSFVTLAHELGHSVNQKAGASPIDQGNVLNTLSQNDHPVMTNTFLWSDPEEYININNVENSIRDQAGLGGQRISHKGSALVNSVANSGSPIVQQRLHNITARLQHLIDMGHPQHSTRAQMILTALGERDQSNDEMPYRWQYLLSNKIYEKTINQIDGLEVQITPQSVLRTRVELLAGAMEGVNTNLRRAEETLAGLNRRNRRENQLTLDSLRQRTNFYLNLLYQLQANQTLQDNYLGDNAQSSGNFRNLHRTISDFGTEIYNFKERIRNL
ncbi:eCIS core domain-containing protein [Portibacter marinus]|uniref:eCIS core domain-containing protein n=1 Tax=Portibacter marinus TaxID=2898660 RepID=UPI001F3788F3|nr:DUF4157 domain-containing protein [Portibacter marinus]